MKSNNYCNRSVATGSDAQIAWRVIKKIRGAMLVQTTLGRNLTSLVVNNMGIQPEIEALPTGKCSFAMAIH